MIVGPFCSLSSDCVLSLELAESWMSSQQAREVRLTTLSSQGHTEKKKVLSVSQSDERPPVWLQSMFSGCLLSHLFSQLQVKA